MIYIFLAEGFEETEAIATADVIIRGGLEVKLASIMDSKTVTGSHGISIQADIMFDESDYNDAEVLVLPGGMPGTTNLAKYDRLIALLKKQHDEGKRIAAICAAPMVFGTNGLLEGKKAVCFPGFEEYLKGADVQQVKALTDGNVTTGRGPGAAIDFGLEIVRILQGEDRADEVAKSMVYR